MLIVDQLHAAVEDTIRRNKLSVEQANKLRLEAATLYSHVPNIMSETMRESGAATVNARVLTSTMGKLRNLEEVRGSSYLGPIVTQLRPVDRAFDFALSRETAPILILREGIQRSTGMSAQRNNILAARAVAETVRATLGPRGMDKMLVEGLGDVTITNDGATILDEMEVQHPAAKMLVEVAKTQDDEVGDGTTTAVVLAGELLKKAERLLDQDVPPTTITEGYKRASEKALDILNSIGVKIEPYDAETLREIAATAIGTGSVFEAKDYLARIAVDAALQVKETRDGKTKVDVDRVKVLKKHGESMKETQLIKGILIDKEIAHPQMPKRIEKAKIALVNAKLEIEKTGFSADIDSPERTKLFLEEVEDMLKETVDKISESGANIVFCEKSIDDIALHFMAKKGIAAVKNVSSGDMDRLAEATGGKIVVTIRDLTSASLGEAKLIEEDKIGDDILTYVRETKNPTAVTIVLRGGTEHVVDEAERSMHEALCVTRDAIEDGKIVAGGGAAEAEIAKQLRDYAAKVGAPERLVIEAFAEAMESVPLTLAENVGLDPIDTMIELRAKHEDPKNRWYGIDVFSGKVNDTRALNVLEPLRVKTQVVKSATEAASMLLRVDDVIGAAKEMKESRQGLGGMPGREES